MLDYTERARDAVLSRAAQYNPKVTSKPTKTRSWETEMPPEQIEIFEAVAGDVLSELGYTRKFLEPRTSARLKGFLSGIGVPVGRLK
jgi:hypothetical protein